MMEYFKSSSVIFSEDDNVFFQNNKRIESEDDSEFTKLDLDKLIKSELNTIINKRYDNILFLAGAGASVVLKNYNSNNPIDERYGKTVRMIADNVKEVLDRDISSYSIEELAKRSNFGVVTSDAPKKVDLKEDFNLEDFLSHILQYKKFLKNKPLVEKKFNYSIEKIFEVIKLNTDYSYDSTLMKHGAILNILSKKVKVPNKLSIVTTNYDVLFEEAAAEEGYVVFDGFTFLSNPTFDANMFDWNLIKEVPNLKTKEVIYQDKIFNLIKIHGSLTWEKQETGSIVRKDSSLIKQGSDTVMIFPSSNKYAQSYQEPYFDLFTKFQELLKRQNTLLITSGFSFADNHITKMITQAIKSNSGLTTLVSDYNISQESENWQKMEELMDSHNPIYFLKATLNGDLTMYLGGNNEN